MKRLVIIDGKSVFYRGYYAMGNLSLADGTPTGGVYGFAAIAMEIVKDLRPDKVVVAWDAKSSTAKRKKLYPEYKAGRVKPGEDFYAQIPLLIELVKGLGWDFVECEEYEADDIIGTLAKQADGAGEWETYIISSDLDMLQIVDKNTRMYRILKGFSKLEELDVAGVEAKYGIKKSQFLDLKALKGDASDNIPGVPGIGEKGAAKLLNEYGSLDGIYEYIDEVKGSIGEKLRKGKESAYLSYKLAKIMEDAPVKLKDIPEFKYDPVRTKEALEKLEFRSLIRKFGLSREGKKALSSSDLNQENIIRWTADRTVSSGDEPVGVVRNIYSPDSNLKYDSERAFLPSKQHPIVEWDVKGVMHEDEGVAEKVLAGAEFWDLEQGRFLLNPLERREEQPEVNKMAEYQRQREEFLKQPKLMKILTEFDLPLIPVLYKMEKQGMLIDREYFNELKKEFEQQVAKIEQEIWQLAGGQFNINSPIQLSEVLFGGLGLPAKGIKKTKRGYSTGAKELAKLKDQHPIVALITEYREIAKLLSTYILPFPDLADKEGRIHTTFTQNVTATGRLSSLNPNLQNIPVRTEEGKRIRTGFVVPKGKKLVSADYSQFELRLAAVLAGDQKLMDDFNAGIDIHTKTASEVFKVPMSEVTKQQRRVAKVVNFGVLYGMSAKGLADATGMNVMEAKRFIEGYFELRRPIKEYLEKILKQAREQGYVETYFGRKRPTPDVKSPNFLIRTGAERAAQNMPIQGTEADLMKRAMIRVDKVLPEGAKMVMQVHDSLMVECEEKVVPEVEKLLIKEMEGVAPELKIKLAVEVKVGDNWGEV